MSRQQNTPWSLICDLYLTQFQVLKMDLRIYKYISRDLLGRLFHGSLFQSNKVICSDAGGSIRGVV